MPADAGEDQHRRFDPRVAQAPKHFGPLHIRQHEVEEDDVVVVDPCHFQTVLTQVGGVDVEALRFEHQLDRLRGGAIVFD